MQQRKTRKKQKKNSFLYFRLFICLVIIGTAFFLKVSNPPIVEKITQTISEELKISDAVNAINDIVNKDNVSEVFGEDTKDEEDNQPEDLFDDDFYIGSDGDAIEKEIEEQRLKMQEEEKRLSVETLSFQMSDDELYDDTKAEPFRIPAPSYCSYDKIALDFKYRSPLCGVVTSKYGYRDHPIIEDASFHTGLDIAAKKGSSIAAFADGKVIDAGKNSTYGNFLLIEHKNGIRSFYGHNSILSVKKGQMVKVGQKIAEVGSTGMSTGPHLHFEIRNGNTRLDPSYYISPETV